MRKLFLIILLLFVNCYLISSSVVAQNYRQDIFQRFNDAVNTDDSRHNPLRDPRVEKAIKFLIVDGNTEIARRLLKEAGWPNGFSIDLTLSVFGKNNTEIQWLKKELKKINVYVQAVN